MPSYVMHYMSGLFWPAGVNDLILKRKLASQIITKFNSWSKNIGQQPRIPGLNLVKNDASQILGLLQPVAKLDVEYSITVKIDLLNSPPVQV